MPNKLNTKKLKVAVVGVGYLGRIHAKIYNSMDEVELIGVVDSKQSTAKEIAAQLGCQWHTSVQPILDLVDAVSIVVPTSLHQEVAQPFLAKGIHTLLEKPIAQTVEMSQEIVDLAQKSGAILQIGHLERFNAGVMKLAELAHNPRFIEVHRLGKFVQRATDVDVVTDLMIHDIDIVLSLVDSELKHISASGTAVITAHVDIANARLEFANGAVANVTASRVSDNQFRRIRVFAERSYFGLNFADQQLQQVHLAEIEDNEKFPQLVHTDIAVKAQQPLNAELADFIDCIKTGRRPLINGEDGLAAVAISEQVKARIHQSISANL